MRYFSRDDFSEMVGFVISKRNRVPVNIFLLMCFNLLLMPAVQAATPGDSPRWQVYTISLLGLATASLCVYLFVVIFQPERF